MKKIFLVRHAKSSWEYEELTDLERPLNKRGRRDAPFMGKLLAQQGVNPEVLISSPANRAVTTARFFCNELGITFDDMIIDPKLYMAGSDQFMNVLRNIENRFESVMLFSHNPGLTDFANFLAGRSIDNIPTCGIVSINSTADSWEDIYSDNCKLVFFEYPKKYFK
jgi:phosphohistidine phosphatase